MGLFGRTSGSLGQLVCRISTAVAGLFACVLASSAAAQGLPTSNFASAPLVTPDEAFIYYGSSTARTSSQNLNGADLRPGRTQEVKTLAVGLGKDDLAAGRITQSEYARRAFEYVRFNVETTFNFGMAKGPHGALVDQSGSAFDNASLFAELLREAGIAASYEAGTINLNAEEFGRWTGLATPTAWDSDGRVTSFSVSAKGACQLLANGGIPATVNGAADSACVNAGNLSSVQLAHIWVAALGQKYDPAFKKQELWKGKDLAAAMQCGTDLSQTCSSGAQNAAMSGVSRGIYSGAVPWTQSVNAAALGSTLTTYAQRLQSSVNAIDRNLSREQLIGGTTIDPARRLAESTAPIQSVTRHVWQEIPDQYRIRFSVQFDNINKSFWADELSAERLRLFGLGSRFVPGSSFTRRTTLYLEFNPIATSTRTGASLSNDNLTLTVNYPYAASGGAYQDMYSSRDTWATSIVQYSSSDAEAFVQPVTIVHQFGSARASSIAEAARTQETSKRWINLVDPTNTAHDVLFSRTITFNTIQCPKQNLWTKIRVGPGLDYTSDPGCLRLHEPTMLQQILAQDTELQRVAGAISGGMVTTHHVIGAFSGGAMNLETSRAVAQADGDTAKAVGLKLASSLMTGWLEGGVFEQSIGEWEGESGLSLLIRSNEKGHRFLQMTSANVSSGLVQLTGYSATERSLISSFTSAGFRVIAPRSGSVGTFSFGSPQATFTQNGLATFQTGYGMLGTVVNDGFKGATPGAGDPYESALKSSKAIMDGFQPQKSFTAGLRDASAALGEFEDLAAGAGEFPDRLSFTRRYSSASPVLPADQSFVTTQDAFSGGANFSHLVFSGPGARIGGGWRHNYDIQANIASSGFQGMGADSALDASRFIAGLYSLIGLGRGTSSFDSELASVFVAHWTGEQLVANVVNVESPLVEGAFVRLPDGSFNPPPAVNARLVQTGERLGPIPAGGGTNSIVYDYSPITFQLTDPAGGGINFNLAGQSVYPVDFGQVFTNLREFKPLKWTFPDGRYVDFQYVRTPWYTQAGRVGEVDCLNVVRNHLGRQLNLAFTGGASGDFTQCKIGTVTNDLGQSVGYSGMPTGHNNSHVGQAYWAPFTFTVTRLDGSRHYFDYNSTMDNPAAAVADSDIIAWRSDSKTYLTIGYDEFQRLKFVDDALTQRQNYTIGGLFDEAWKRSGTRNPLNAVTTVVLDPQGRRLLDIDPLGLSRARSYDQVGRLASEVNPEQDSKTYAYDQKSNLVLECRLPKNRFGQPCTAGTDLLRQTTYVEAGAACSNYRTCNKPLFTIDANGHRTNYSWSSVHGGLLSETRGLNAAGLCIITGGCPVTTYGYTAFPGADGTSFHLLTSKTEKIDATTSRVTTFAYNAANRYTLREMVVDSGGMNLRTCLNFDAAGNLISKTDPNAGLGSCP